MDHRWKTTDGRTFDYVPGPGERPIKSITTIDGYTFRGGGYPAAADFWYYGLYKQPGYVPYPPKLSVSVEIEVSGTVGDGDR